MIRQTADATLYVATLGVAGPVRPRDARDLWRRVDQIGRTRGAASILLDLTAAEGPVPEAVETPPLAVPSALVRVAALGDRRWTAWAAAVVGEMGGPPVRTFARGEASAAARYVRTFPALPERTAEAERIGVGA